MLPPNIVKNRFFDKYESLFMILILIRGISHPDILHLYTYIMLLFLSFFLCLSKYNETINWRRLLVALPALTPLILFNQPISLSSRRSA